MSKKSTPGGRTCRLSHTNIGFMADGANINVRQKGGLARLMKSEKLHA